MGVNKLYNVYQAGKQIAKTVKSPITHARNIIKSLSWIRKIRGIIEAKLITSKKAWKVTIIIKIKKFLLFFSLFIR